MTHDPLPTKNLAPHPSDARNPARICQSCGSVVREDRSSESSGTGAQAGAVGEVTQDAIIDLIRDYAMYATYAERSKVMKEIRALLTQAGIK